MKICILGSGTWGTALSHVLNKNNQNVSIWSRDVSKNKNNSINYFSDLNKISDFNILIIALPSQSIKNIFNQISPFIKSETIILNASKGFDRKTMNPISLTLFKNFNIKESNYSVISGPSHAEEVLSNIPTALVLASKNHDHSNLLQKIFSNQFFRIYTTSDVIGLEVAASCKNIISIAAGICFGIGYGDNTVAALITRGVNEIVRLGMHFNAEKETFYGLGGFGDLSVTAYSKHSRNRAFGTYIAQNLSIEDAKRKVGMVVEGVHSTDVIYKISTKYQINMPIVNEVYSILFNQKCPKSAINDLMYRKLGKEFN